jgi:gamma-glutamyltranspeptidase/glutathione hydrolase
MTVSWTTTIEENLGSAVVVPGRGFLLNNELTDFTAEPTDPATGAPLANRPEGGKRARRSAADPAEQVLMGGKRPMSSMTPSMVAVVDEQGRVVDVAMAMGSPGGSKIIGTVLNVLERVIRGGEALLAATRAPRLVARNMDPALVERRIFDDAALRTGIEATGLNITADAADPVTGHVRPLGFVQSVARETNGSVVAVADRTRLSTAGAGGI